VPDGKVNYEFIWGANVKRLLAILAVLLLWPSSQAMAHGNPTECLTLFESNGFILPNKGPLNSIWLAHTKSKIQDFWCETSPAGSTITIDPKVNGTDILTAPLVCNDSGVYGTVDLLNSTVLRGELVDLGWSGGTGQPYRLTVCFEHTIS
jgi:hypothetical protein